MLRHIVLYKFHEPAKENAERAKGLFLSMSGKIPGLISISAGGDVTGSARSYDGALVCDFTDADALRAYRENPEHKKVSSIIHEIMAESASVDFIIADE